MKTHAKNAALGGGLVPVALAAAAAIGNASQQALDLGLQGIALAIYLVGFIIAAAIVIAFLVKVEGQKALAALGTPEGLDALGELADRFGLGDLLGGKPAAGSPVRSPFPPSPSGPSSGLLPPSPPSP